LLKSTQSGLEVSSGDTQEQDVRKETKDNGGLETEHQGRSAAIPPAMLQRVMQNFKKCLRECVDYNRRHLTDAIFRNGILQLK
jgi:hypothetical protein